MLMLGAAVRFIHFALFGGTLVSIHYYVVDSLVCMAFGFAGFQAARARRMVAQYPWMSPTARCAGVVSRVDITLR